MSSKVFLIMGASGAGKSTTSRQLAATMSAGTVSADQIWMGLRSWLPNRSPARRALELDRAIFSRRHSPDRLAELQAEGARVLWPAVAGAIEMTANESPIVVAEGAWILPEVAPQLAATGKTVRSVVIYEHDIEAIGAALRNRGFGSGGAGSGGGFGPTRLLRAAIDVHTKAMLGSEDPAVVAALHYGEWLVAQGAKHGIPVVAARPRESLFARVRTALGLERETNP